MTILGHVSLANGQRAPIPATEISCDLDDDACGWEAQPFQQSWKLKDSIFELSSSLSPGPSAAYLSSPAFVLPSAHCFGFSFRLHSPFGSAQPGVLSLSLLGVESGVTRTLWNIAQSLGPRPAKVKVPLPEGGGTFKLVFVALSSGPFGSRFTLDDLEFRCSSVDFCRPAESWCDGVRDCGPSEPSEEAADCSRTCPPGWSPCGRGRDCVRTEQLCDGWRDCPDAEDEAFCVCEDGERRCRDGPCLPSELFCNGRRDCMDGSDEGPQCACLVDRAHPWHCDGLDDCLDRSDEDLCCPDGAFSCPEGSCVEASRVCDGRPDCLTGEDEEDCWRLRSLDVQPDQLHTRGLLTATIGGVGHQVCAKTFLPDPGLFLRLCRRMGFAGLAGVSTERLEPRRTSALAHFVDRSERVEKTTLCPSRNVYLLDCGEELSCDAGLAPPILPPRSPLSRRFRVVGGRRAGGGDAFPWHAALFHRFPVRLARPDMYLCGGTVIDQNWILTAAHCVPDDWRVEGRLQIRVGLRRLSQPPSSTQLQQRQVAAVHPHPLFRKSRMKYDIALLRLEKPLLWTKFVKPACVDWDGRTGRPGSFCQVAGFGRTRSGSEKPSLELKVAELRLLSEFDCRASSLLHRRNYFEGLLCAWSSSGGPCQGDSGGALVCEAEGGRLVSGVASFAPSPCASAPAAFARVAHYRHWLRDVMEG